MQLVPAGVDKTSPTGPSSFILRQNYPNPLNSGTIIEFDLKNPELTSLSIYNVAGQLVRTLKREVLPPGTHRVRWDGRDDNGRYSSAGVYFYRIEAGDFTRTGRMVLIK
jgi:hypothetical protein